MPDVLPEVNIEQTINFSAETAREYVKNKGTFRDVSVFNDEEIMRMAIIMMTSDARKAELQPPISISKNAIDWVVNNPINALREAARQLEKNENERRFSEIKKDLELSQVVTETLIKDALEKQEPMIALPLKLVKQLDAVLSEIRASLCECDSSKGAEFNVCQLHVDPTKNYVQVKVG